MTAHGGVIKDLWGLEECKKIPGVIYAEFLLSSGDVVVENNSMAQSVFRTYINACDKEALKAIILEIQKNIQVIDIDGRDMLFKHFDVERLK